MRSAAIRRRTRGLSAVSRVKFAAGARCYGRSHVVATRLPDPHRRPPLPSLTGGADVRAATPRCPRRACRRCVLFLAIARSIRRPRGPCRFRRTSPAHAAGTHADARLLRLIPLGRKPVPAAGGGPRPAFFICGVSSALASFGACGLARAVRWLRHRPIAPPRTLQAPAAAMAAGLLARALRKLRPQPDTGRTQAPDTAQARGERAADAPKLRFRYRRRRQGLLVCAQQHIPLDAAKGRSVHGGPSPAAPAPAAPAEPGRA
ncbi:hypothetical protein SAMN04487939_102208 [Lysobacter sp. yr284]|nr:hypothetical protein SAMN04487939_102208 [Lysobacter sp. yr284]